MDQDQEDARGFVPRNGCGFLGLPKPAPDLETWQETNTYRTDYIWQTLGRCHRAVNIRRPWECVVGGWTMVEPVPILTVGDLKSELARWSDDAPVNFYSPLKEQQFRFYRYQPGQDALVLEINEFPETSPAVLGGAKPV